MEHQDSLAVESSFCTPYGWDDTVQSAKAAGKKLEQELELLDFSCTPTDVELVQDYLRPASQRMLEEPTLSAHIRSSRAVVNGHLLPMNPWELPGLMPNKEGMRDKYYFTDNTALVYYGAYIDRLCARNGFWKTNGSDRGIWAENNGFVGIKRTLKFRPYTGHDALSLSGTKGNWIMNIYYCNNELVWEGLILCHVFETDSTDYYDAPNCHPGECNRNYCRQAFGGPNQASFVHPGSRLMQHDPKMGKRLFPDPDPECRSNPMLNSYIAELANLLLGDPDPDNYTDTGNSSARRGAPPMADHGQSKKRKKSSDVWDYFTKIFARDINGKVLTFAACNHCCKILSGNSKGGTTHLARHTCPCKFKPVEAGRKDKGSGGDVNNRANSFFEQSGGRDSPPESLFDSGFFPSKRDRFAHGAPSGQQKGGVTTQASTTSSLNTNS